MERISGVLIAFLPLYIPESADGALLGFVSDTGVKRMTVHSCL